MVKQWNAFPPRDHIRMRTHKERYAPLLECHCKSMFLYNLLTKRTKNLVLRNDPSLNKIKNETSNRAYRMSNKDRCPVHFIYALHITHAHCTNSQRHTFFKDRSPFSFWFPFFRTFLLDMICFHFTKNVESVFFQFHSVG